MKKSDIVKKYIDLCGKRPTMKVDENLSKEDLMKAKQELKVNQYSWSLKKSIFIEYIEKSKESDEQKIISAKKFIDSFTSNDLLKIYHGYQYSLNIENKTYMLFQD